MTDTSGPFEPDKPWGESEWFKHMPAAMPSGVIGTQASSASTGALSWSATGLTPTIGIGSANVGGAGFDRDTAVALTAVTANAHATWSRRDRLVLRRSLGSHDVTFTRIQGTAAASPTSPAITRNATTFDLKLFSFLVPPSSGSTISGVVDERTWVSDGTEAGAQAGSIALLHGTGTQSIASGGSHKAVVLGSLQWSPGMSVDVSTGEIIANADGRYEASGGVLYTAAGASLSGYRVASLLKNGTLEPRSQNRSDPDTANSVPIATAAYPFTLLAGESVQLGTFQNAGVAQDIDRASCFLQVHYIGPA